MRAYPPTRLRPARLPFDVCQSALGGSGCERVDRITRGVNDAIHGIGDLVSAMAGKILGKGIAKELAAGPLCTAREQLGPFNPKTAVGALLRGQLSYIAAVTWKAIVT